MHFFTPEWGSLALALVGLWVRLEHRLTRLETMMDEREKRRR